MNQRKASTRNPRKTLPFGPVFNRDQDGGMEGIEGREEVKKTESESDLSPAPSDLDDYFRDAEVGSVKSLKENTKVKGKTKGKENISDDGCGASTTKQTISPYFKVGNLIGRMATDSIGDGGLGCGMPEAVNASSNTLLGKVRTRSGTIDAGGVDISLGKRKRGIATSVKAGVKLEENEDEEQEESTLRDRALVEEAKNLTGSFANAETNAHHNLSVSAPRQTRKRKAIVKKEEANSEEDDSLLSIPIARARPSRKKSRTILKVESEEMKHHEPDYEIEDVKPFIKGKRKFGREGSISTHAKTPPNWKDLYDSVKEMRSTLVAPVDTMGCERLAQPESDVITPQISRFQSLVALMLSSQTKDTVTAVAIHNLQTQLPSPGLCIPSILAVPPETLNSLIKMVGFHNRKTQYIKQAAQILHTKYNDDIPSTIEELTALPGVGPKMAYLCLSVAWNRTEGIGVDVHVHRLANLWGWVKTKTPEETRLALESWLPKEFWREINWLWVGFGQVVCVPRAPKCGECLLAERGLCRAAKVPPSGAAKGRAKARVGKVKVESSDFEGQAKEDSKVNIKYEFDPDSTTEPEPQATEDANKEVEQVKEIKEEGGAIKKEDTSPSLWGRDDVRILEDPLQLKQELKHEEDEQNDDEYDNNKGKFLPDMEDIVSQQPLPSPHRPLRPSRKRGRKPAGPTLGTGSGT